MVDRPVLRYHGGKWLLAKWIISHMPKHRVYVEPFGGAASVLLQKPRVQGEVYNDLWSEVVNLFRILRDPKKAEELRKQLVLTPYAREEFELSRRPAKGSIERARRLVFLSYAGYSPASATSGKITGFRNYDGEANRRTAPASDWLEFPAHIEQFVERLQGVIIEHRNAAEIMLKHDSPETLHYVDPPYVESTRKLKRKNATYACEMDDEAQVELSCVLKELKGMVILSGYRSALYETLYDGWPSIERSARADGARLSTEVIWFNPTAWANRPQMTLLEAVA